MMKLRHRIVLTFLPMLLVPFVAVTILQVDRTMKVMIASLGQAGELVIGQVFEQIRTDLKAAPSKPAQTLGSDPLLAALLRSSEAFGPGVVYSRIETLDGHAIAGSAAEGVGPPPPFIDLENEAASLLPWAPIAAVWRGQTYELRRQVELGNKPFAVIRVGLSTALLANEAHRSVKYIIGVGVAGIALAFIGAMLVTGLLREPIALLVSSVKEVVSGPEELTLTPTGGDELESVVEKFNELAARIKMNRVRWETERGQFFDMFHSITDAVLLLDASGLILFANAEAQQRLGLPAGGLADGKSLRLLLGSDSALVRAIDTAVATGIEVRDAPVELGAGSGAQRLLISVFALGRGPEPPGMLVVARDLKLMKELETVVEHSDRLARLGSVISGVAHQIRNPLNAMNLQLELLSHDVDESSPALKRVRALRAEVERLDRAIDALLRFMRPEQLKLASVPLNALLGEVAGAITRPQVRVEYDFDTNVRAITGDRALLAEALRNIVSNAVEAMPQGGRLTIGSRRLPDGVVELRISDEGGGIAPQDSGRIFNLYFTTKKGGNGLGLPLALRAIDLHQGTIEVESQPGSGTTVKIRLPIGHRQSPMAQRESA